MSKYIIIDDGYTATLGERQEDGSYKTLDLSEKGALVRLLEEIANDGSVREAGVRTELTLDERIERLREAGYDISNSEVRYPTEIRHRDALLGDELATCMSGTLEEFVIDIEEDNNARI